MNSIVKIEKFREMDNSSVLLSTDYSDDKSDFFVVQIILKTVRVCVGVCTFNHVHLCLVSYLICL